MDHSGPGQPTKMTDETLKVLDEAFALGCSDTEACLMANISPKTLYNYQNANPEYVHRKEQLKETPVLLARSSVVNALKRNPNLALQFLERKKKAEFAPRTELTGPEGTPLGYVYSSDIKQIESKEIPQLPELPVQTDDKSLG